MLNRTYDRLGLRAILASAVGAPFDPSLGLFRFSNAMACAPEKAEHVELSLREALVNAILHGNRADPAKKVMVACFCERQAAKSSCESTGSR